MWLNKPCKKVRDSNSSFTLLGLLVVISLVLTISALILPRYKRGEQLFAIQRSSYKLAEDIGRAREMAISVREFKGEIPKGGWGVYLTKGASTYILFADLANFGAYDVGEELSEISLEAGVGIKELSPASPLTIVFKGPDPVVTINQDENITTAVITLSISSFEKTISVNKAGLIEIE